MDTQEGPGALVGLNSTVAHGVASEHATVKSMLAVVPWVLQAIHPSQFMARQDHREQTFKD